MGLQSWKKEFYPISAYDAAASADTRTIIAHSLKKWQGLLPENIKRHSVVLRYGRAVANKSGYGGYYSAVYIDSSSCSLCKAYFFTSGASSSCARCPLYKVRGNVSCFTRKRGEKKDPYSAGTGTDPNPRPMIRWLKKALADEVAKQKKRTKKAKRVR